MHLARVLTVALALAVSAGTAEAQRRCVKGIPCGNTCIAANKTCRISGGSATGSSRTVQQAVTPPADAQFVASSRGQVYYWVGCNGWKSLAPANLRFFKTAAEARAAGYRPSTQAGCQDPAEPAAAAQPAAAAAVAALPVLAGRPPRAIAGQCTVLSIVDGDTLHCTDGVTVRLLTIDAPEPGGNPYGQLSKHELEQLAPPGARLGMEYDSSRTDRFGRTLAYLYLEDGRMLNEALVRMGMAQVAVYPPDVRYVERLRAIEDSARTGKRGLWATGAFVVRK